MSIRNATPSDIDAIEHLIAENPDTLLERSHQEIEQLLETFWVAEADGKVVGCCCLEIYSPKIAELRTLAVDKEYRGRGLGARLALRAVEEARRRKIPQVLAVTSNKEFFERIGFGLFRNEKFAMFWSGESGG